MKLERIAKADGIYAMSAVSHRLAGRHNELDVHLHIGTCRKNYTNEHQTML
jgi:hypothetical protein